LGIFGAAMWIIYMAVDLYSASNKYFKTKNAFEVQSKLAKNDKELTMDEKIKFIKNFPLFTDFKGPLKNCDVYKDKVTCLMYIVKRFIGFFNVVQGPTGILYKILKFRSG
jgi:hypothetical protein